MRVAAIDLGTNSTRLLVADVEDGHVWEVARRLTITRLGEGVGQSRQLLPTAMARVHTCLVEYRRELEDLGAARTLAIATSAVRDANNGGAFLGDVESSFGFTTRLLSGSEEAALTLRGVFADRSSDGDRLVVDIGGGSTELVLGGASGSSFSTSLEIGCVRLTERFLTSDPPSARELDACAAYVREVLPSLQAGAAVGVAGTVTTLAALDLGLAAYDASRIHRHVLSRAAVERELRHLAGLSLSERERIPAIEPGRASVIVGGVIILREVLDAYGLAAIEASEHDILQGAALAAAELPEPEEGLAPPGAFTSC